MSEYGRRWEETMSPLRDAERRLVDAAVKVNKMSTGYSLRVDELCLAAIAYAEAKRVTDRRMADLSDLPDLPE